MNNFDPAGRAGMNVKLEGCFIGCVSGGVTFDSEDDAQVDIGFGVGPKATANLQVGGTSQDIAEDEVSGDANWDCRGSSIVGAYYGGSFSNDQPGAVFFDHAGVVAGPGGGCDIGLDFAIPVG